MSTAPGLCPACATPPRRGLRLRNGAALLQCPRCRLAWWDWPAFEPSAFYDQDYFQSADATKGYSDYAAMEPAIRRTAQARLRRLGSLLRGERPGRAAARSRSTAPYSPRLLELGCGTGVFLDTARMSGFQCSGAEVSPYAAARAAARGLEVRCAAIEELNPEANAFDVVCLWDVIEHVRDPAAVLRVAATALRPGGVLALSTGDITSLCARLSGAAWHLFNLPEHLFFFSPAWLRRLLRGAGCEVVHVQREVNWIPLTYAVERLFKPLGARPPRLPAVVQRFMLPATLLDVIGVYARRTRP